MDPVSQGVVGAVLASACAKKEETRIALLAGALSGMAADLDVLIRSSEDTLLTIEYHRHFTHSLLFVPLGGLIVAGLLWVLLNEKISFRRLYFYCFLGYGTAGLLDACTSYGTQLFWPFSGVRVAWSIIAIIDPVFTFTLVVLSIFAWIWKIPLLTRLGVCFALLYLSFGKFQHNRVVDEMEQLAEQRGHKIERSMVRPSVFNLVLWRGIYEYDGDIYVDGIRVGLFVPVVIYPGEKLEKFVLDRDLGDLSKDSVLYRDMIRFLHFSDDYVSFSRDREHFLGDVRYAFLPNEIKPLWGIEFDPKQPDKHAQFMNLRSPNKELLEQFKAMLFGKEMKTNR